MPMSSISGAGTSGTRERPKQSPGKAIQCFEEALRLEADYPEAMAFLGLQYGSLGYYGYASTDEMYAKAGGLVAKALELDDAIPEAHHIMGVLAYYVEGDWAKAEFEFKKSLDINPSYAEACSDYAVFLVSVGRTDESQAEIEKSLELDPLNVVTHNVAGAIYQLVGRYDEALDHHHTALEMEPENEANRTNYGLTLVVMGRLDEGVKELEKAMAIGRSSFHRSNLGCAYAVAGRREAALKLAEEIRTDPNVGHKSYDLAAIYACLGEKKQALEWLEEAYEEHAIFTFSMFNTEPFLASLRDEPRFKELVKKAGLDKYQPVSGKNR